MLVVLTTFASREKAEEVAWSLVQEELAACVNVLPGVQSIYRWKGEVETESEVACLIKTTEAAWERLRARLVELHPYEVPEVVALPASSVHAPYLEWVTSSVK